MKKYHISSIRLKISHTNFCLLYTTVLYVVCNALIVDKIAKWFYLKDDINYPGMLAYYGFGLCIFILIFTLFAHRWTIKPLAIFFILTSAIAVYFIAIYDVAVDASMIMNTLYTDIIEVRGLLSIRMLPYALFLIVLPIVALFFVQITFVGTVRYLLASLVLCILVIAIAVGLLYAQFDPIHRAGNISKKYILHQTVPVNLIQSAGSILQNYIEQYHTSSDQPEFSADVLSPQENLIVVFAIGETSRQKNFSLYGYTRKNTTPVLSKYKNLYLLNGIARKGSTLYALPEILARDGVPLAAITSKAGIHTQCYVNFSLYDNCDPVGETHVTNCKHGNCYDEDVVPLLESNLKSYSAGSRLIILHLGGGSHGPGYHHRYPPEFQVFRPMCFNADVVNDCTLEELYNSYDNSILYVDYVLGTIINKLETSKLPYVLIYLSDHGESLMENGRIFHGMPPGIALPPEQAHIPLIVKSSIPLALEKRQAYGQPDVFDTILALLFVETDVSDKSGSFLKKLK